MWMNQPEIEWAFRQQHACPNVRKGIKLLYRLMQYTNEHSDGWPYASPVSKSADKLVELLKTAGNLQYGTSGKITAAQLKAAITPIRRMATVQKVKQAGYGNTFDFNVDAALAS